MNKEFDVFISHASPDKETFVRPLAAALQTLGVRVWYDEFSLELGDSISEQIDRGISGARFGIVVISAAFLSRNWTKHELRGLISRDVYQDVRILPIWHGVNMQEVSDFSPSLADKLAIDTSQVTAQDAAIRILRLVRPDLYAQHPRTEFERLVSGDAVRELQQEIDDLREEVREYRCPFCSASLVSRIDAPMDAEEKHWDVVETFACGLRLHGGEVGRPCPSDPAFPQFEDFELKFLTDADRSITCFASPRTVMARKLGLSPASGATKEQAADRMRSNYLYAAGKLSNKEWFSATTG